MRLKLGEIFWEPDEILFLTQRALSIPQVAPQGKGTHLEPFQMTSVEEWYTAAVDPPINVKRAFYVVGGRLLHRRLNRDKAKYSDYITECGPWNSETREAIDKAKESGKFKWKIDASADQYQTDRFDQPARWYTRPGSGIAEDSDLQGLGAIGPTYNSLADAIEKVAQGGANDVDLAKRIRGCLTGQSKDVPASVACMTAAWFLGEVKRHPRSMLSALILLDLIEGKHSADEKELYHANAFTFQKVISKQSTLPHPMSGKGTVDKASSANKRTLALKQKIDENWEASESGVKVQHQRQNKGLNIVEARESEIIIRWLARRLHDAGFHDANFDNAPDVREKVHVTVDGQKLYLTGLITAELWKRTDRFNAMV